MRLYRHDRRHPYSEPVEAGYDAFHHWFPTQLEVDQTGIVLHSNLPVLLPYGKLDREYR